MGKIKLKFVAAVIGLALLPSAVCADVPPPPRRLHRVGFEIFKKTPPAPVDRAEPSVDENAPLTEAEEKELQEQITQLKVFLGGKTEVEFGNGKTLKYADMVQELRRNFRKLKAIETKIKNGESVSGDEWKYPRQVTQAERMVIDAKIEAVKSELQVLFDATYAKMNAAGELKKISPLTGGREYLYRRAKWEMAAENALTVVKRILEKDEALRMRCEGVPVEWLANAVKCPEPSFDDAVVKAKFRDWAFERMPNGLSYSERQGVFEWQFFVVEKEKRAWRPLALSSKARTSTRWGNRFTFVQNDWRRNGAKKFTVEPGFEDFSRDFASASEFVEFWYGKAVAAGMKPSVEDNGLLEKARVAKKPWTGNPNISLSRGNPRKIMIRASIPAEEVKKARSALIGGLGMGRWSRFDLELDSPDYEFLKTVVSIFGEDAIDQLVLSSDDSKKLDISPLAGFKHVRLLSLRNCTVEKSASLSGWEFFGKCEADDCTLGELTFLSGCGNLRGIELKGCAFSGMENLWALEKLEILSIPNSKNEVDLSIVRKLKNLETLDVSGCSVTNFTALKGHSSLECIKMKNLKGGVESLAFLADLPRFRDVEYLKSDFAPSVYQDYARTSRRKKYADEPERMLRAVVEDRDLPEIRSLCEKGTKADGALLDFKWTSESDVAVFKLLVPNASPHVVTEQLRKCVSLFGYGHRSSSKKTCVPTNRMEIISALMKQGANPDDAIKDVERPSKDDFAWFKLMSGKASKKALTELLQKNVSSFGRDVAKNLKTEDPVDRNDFIEFLLKNGADPNMRNFFGKTTLGNAVVYDGDMALVKILVENGADVSLLYPEMELFREFYQDHENVWGTNRYELVEILLARGFDVNAKGKSGRTPLGEIVAFAGWHYAYDLKMVKLLLEHGADPNAAQGGNEGSAIDMAYAKRDAEELLALLEKHGGKVSEKAKTQKNKYKGGRDAENKSVDGRKPRFSPDRIQDEMKRFHEEMRKVRTAEEHRKAVEEHSRRMRELH